MHSTDNLEDGYIGSGTYLWHSIKKYGRENFKMEILEFCTNRESLKTREAELITEEMLKDPMCMNLSFGGGDIKLTHEQYVARNKLCNQRFQEKMNLDAGLRKKFSDRMAKTNQENSARWNKIHNITKNKARIGTRRSEESKKKISENVSGEKNGMFGKVWMKNETLKLSKRFSKDEICDMISLGWELGRKMFK
jgi:hypothetical protein